MLVLSLGVILTLISCNQAGAYPAYPQYRRPNLVSYTGRDTITEKPFIKRRTNNPEEKPLLEIKKQLLQGVGKSNFQDDIAVSSFKFTQPFHSLLKLNQQSFGVFGNYGKGKIFAFGHPGIFGSKVSQEGEYKKLLRNVINWMAGKQKGTINVGLLFQSGVEWPEYGWEKYLDLDISTEFVEDIEEFCGQDIIGVTYYSNYPKALTHQFIDKLKCYVKNGGNLFFGSHGWVWEYYGEYKDNHSLVYEKDFAGYVILKAFGIDLNKDFFSITNYDFSSNL